MPSLTILPDLSLLAILGCIPLRNQLQLAPMCRHWAFLLLPQLWKSRRRLFLLIDDGVHHQDRRALQLITCSPNRVHNYHRLRDTVTGRPLRTLPGHMWLAPLPRSTLSFSMMLSQSRVSQLIGLFPSLKQLTISTATETVDAETVWRVVLVPFVGALSPTLRRLHLYGYYGFWEFTVPALECATVSYTVAQQLFQALNGCAHLRDLTLELRNRYRLAAPVGGQATELDLPLLRQLDCFTYLNIAVVLSNRVPEYPTRVGHDLLWPSILRYAVPGPRPLYMALRKASFYPPISEDCDLSPVYGRLPHSFTRRCLQANRFAQIHTQPSSFYGTFSRLVQVEMLQMGRLPAFLAPLATLPSLLSLTLLGCDFTSLHMKSEEVERLVGRGKLPILPTLKSLYLQLGWLDNGLENCTFRGHRDFVDLPVAAFCPALQILELQVKASATCLLKCSPCHLEEGVSSAQVSAIASTIAAGHRLEEKCSVEERCTRQLLEPLLACQQMHTLLLSFVEMPHHKSSAIRTSLRDTVEINWSDWREKGTLLA